LVYKTLVFLAPRHWRILDSPAQRSPRGARGRRPDICCTAVHTVRLGTAGAALAGILLSPTSTASGQIVTSTAPLQGTRTVTPTPHPSPPSVIHYSAGGYLTEYAPFPGPTVEYPLSGTLDVVSSRPPTGGQPFDFAITHLQLDTGTYTITGDSGSIVPLRRPITGDAISFAAALSLNGRPALFAGTSGLGAVVDYPPSLNLDACTGFDGTPTACTTLSAGNSPGYELSLYIAALETPTPFPTPTPLPTVAAEYQLTENSTILASTSIGSAPEEQPLSGSLTLAPVNDTQGGIIAPNTLLGLAVPSFHFSSASFTLAGSGGISVTTLDYRHLYMELTGTTDGQPIVLQGGATFDQRYPPLILRNVQLCGGAPDHYVSCDAIRTGTDIGYVIMLSAAPVPPVPTCVGDCNGDGRVTVGEIIQGVAIDLGQAPISFCPAVNCAPIVGAPINCLIVAVNNSLSGCPPPP
jgi:hypothetical protein